MSYLWTGGITLTFNLDTGFGRVILPPRPNFESADLRFHGLQFGNSGEYPKYPKWMHKQGEKPIKVRNVDEEHDAISKGWDNISAGQMSNRTLSNWFWDLEDLSSKQLSVYAREEFGVDLPLDANQDKLFMAVIELARYAPQNRNRLTLMAHTMKMNYDETIEEIKRMIAGEGQSLETEVITQEVWA